MKSSVESNCGPADLTTTTHRRVVVVGQGFVGLPVALLAHRAGHTVVGFDTDPARIARLRVSDSFIGDVSSAQLRAALNSGRFSPSGDPVCLREFDIALIAVPTPIDKGVPDLRCVEAAAYTLVPYLRPGCTVVLESTTYPGTTEEVVAPILERSGLRAGTDFRLGYAPERLNPGAGFADIARVPKIVAGIDADSLADVAEFWQGLVDTVIEAPSIRTAEFAKLVENAFRLVNISFVNELAQHAHALGVSIWDTLRLAATKSNGYMDFHPGVGAGGHCLPSDSEYLSWRLRSASSPHTPALLETATRINDNQPAYIADRILRTLARNPETACGRAHVVVVGATYKPDVPDVRDSAALKAADVLRARGVCVTVVDPLVGHLPQIERELTPELVGQASIVVLLVAHHFLDYALIGGARRVFDACGVLSPAPNIEHL